METIFASPERASEEQLKAEIEHIKNLPLIKELTCVVTDAFMVLNKHRQVVYCNKTLMDLLDINEPEGIYGLRPGEALKCIHSGETEGGCGTTAFCKHCGAVNAIVKSQNEENIIKEEECHLIAGEDELSFDFMVRAKTLNLANEMFTLFIVRNIGDEKRRQVLERIFFHDILNTAGGVQGLVGLMHDSTEEEKSEFLDLAESSLETLIEEINVQRDLLAAENDNLEIEMTALNSLDILSSVIAIYQNHQVAENKRIKIDDNSISKSFISDQRLLKRVIGNMAKNALEAEMEGETIIIGSSEKDNKIEFWVNNPSVMPEEVKRQVFQRSFSTKGSGRGLGTYSIKLLGEKYLKGKVRFSSEENQGTLFSIELQVS